MDLFTVLTISAVNFFIYFLLWKSVSKKQQNTRGSAFVKLEPTSPQIIKASERGKINKSETLDNDPKEPNITVTNNKTTERGLK